jgi:hypothetical protein
MLKQLSENELEELHVIHQVIGQLSLAHRPLAWGGRGVSENIQKDKMAVNTLHYLSLIHSETENIKDVLSDLPMNDLHSYKDQIKEAITRADKKYNYKDLHPETITCVDNIRDLLEM